MPKRVDKQLVSAAILFAALGDPTRLALLDRLSDGGPASITALADRFDLTRQGISKHLQVLASAGVIDGRREGREHVWAINLDRLAEARRRLDLISRDWASALSRLKTHIERG
jgi:DNA-binding transcriptional ArsR family regulator